MALDTQILLFAAAHRSQGLDQLFRGVTWLGSLYVLAPLALALSAVLAQLQKRWEAWFLVIGLSGATLLVHVLKLVLARPRPAVGERLVALPPDSSFPSAHTMQATAFMLCVLLVVYRIWPQWGTLTALVAALSILLVGASRIYLQVHYPSDVLAGLVLGGAWVLLVRKLL